MKWINLRYSRLVSDLHARLGAMASLATAVDEQLSTALELRRVAERNAIESAYREEEDEDQLAFMNHELDQLNERFEKQLVPRARLVVHYAHLVSLWIYVEEACAEVYEAITGRNLPRKQGGSSFAEMVARHLKEDANVVAENEYWDTLRALGLVRNCIVHYNGNTGQMGPDKVRTVSEVVTAQPDLITINENGRLAFGVDYVVACIDQVWVALQRIISHASQKLPNGVGYSFPPPSAGLR